MTVTSDPAPDHRLVSSDRRLASADREVVAADELRRLMRRHATTVTVITIAGADRPVGFTATSFTSVSLRPPLVSFCVGRGSSCWQVLETARHVGVHLLGAGQAEVARTFATGGIDRFAGPTAWQPGPYGVPLLDGVLAWLVCRVADRIVAGDHAIVLAEPVLAEHAEGAPLLYHNGRYACLL